MRHWAWMMTFLGTQVGLACAAGAAEAVTYHKFDAMPGAPLNVVAVVDDVALAHTAQLFPVNEQGVVEAKSADEQFELLDAKLKTVLETMGEVRLVKLNVYASSEEAVTVALARLKNVVPKPAISLVVTPLPVPQALLAWDVVAAVPGEQVKAARRRVPGNFGSPRASHLAILPRGEAVYVSGQAEPGKTIHAASKATFEGLFKTMEHLQLPRENIVQFKVFLDPMEKSGEVVQALEELMPAGLLPPLVFVQWEAPGSVEIEMIAAAPPAGQDARGDSISFITPPWMDASPNYCRVTRVHGRKIAYFPSFAALAAGDGAAQVRSVYEQLGAAAKLVGTDYEHLAKATYYVSDNDSSTQLNKLRPNYYNPKRPPAASKASVKHTGFPERSFTMDMIGVVPPPAKSK